MTAAADALADAAERLVGTPFRLHGRDRHSGLDCVGMVGAALVDVGRTPRLPQGYSLRMADIAPLLGCAQSSGLVPVQAAPPERGDILLVSPGPAQHHLVIVRDCAAIIHAHAGLGRVVMQPLDGEWSRLGHWRLAPVQPEN